MRFKDPLTKAQKRQEQDHDSRVDDESIVSLFRDMLSSELFGQVFLQVCQNLHEALIECSYEAVWSGVLKSD